jgi:hypothetical protein
MDIESRFFVVAEAKVTHKDGTVEEAVPAYAESDANIDGETDTEETE